MTIQQTIKSLSGITLEDFSKMPIEQIALMSTEELLELAREANAALVEAKGQKDWIEGIIAIRNLMNDRENHNDRNNNNLILGGVNELFTDY